MIFAIFSHHSTFFAARGAQRSCGYAVVSMMYCFAIFSLRRRSSVQKSHIFLYIFSICVVQARIFSIHFVGSGSLLFWSSCIYFLISISALLNARFTEIANASFPLVIVSPPVRNIGPCGQTKSVKLLGLSHFPSRASIHWSIFPVSSLFDGSSSVIVQSAKTESIWNKLKPIHMKIIKKRYISIGIIDDCHEFHSHPFFDLWFGVFWLRREKQ